MPAHRTRTQRAALSALAALGFLAALPAAGAALMDLSDSRPLSPATPCSTRYPTVGTLAFEASDPAAVEALLRVRTDALDRLWGIRENARLVESDVGPALEIRYPEGSRNPGAEGRPLGGAGFVARLGRGGLEAACLRYPVRFEDGFVFALGGKLPGLYGGSGPTGSESTADGFSTRLMWRRDGAGEVYAYVVNMEPDHGASIGRGLWSFAPGRWIVLEQEVVLNEPGRADGVLRLWVNGRQVVEQDDIVYRTDRSVAIDGLMFSTFFGGSSGEWESPRDQSTRFGTFELLGVR